MRLKSNIKNLKEQIKDFVRNKLSEIELVFYIGPEKTLQFTVFKGCTVNREFITSIVPFNNTVIEVYNKKTNTVFEVADNAFDNWTNVPAHIAVIDRESRVKVEQIRQLAEHDFLKPIPFNCTVTKIIREYSNIEKQVYPRIGDEKIYYQKWVVPKENILDIIKIKINDGDSWAKIILEIKTLEVDTMIVTLEFGREGIYLI